MANDKTGMVLFCTDAGISKAEAAIGKRAAKLAADHNTFSRSLGALLPADLKAYTAADSVRDAVALTTAGKGDVLKLLKSDDVSDRKMARRIVATLPGAYGVRGVLSVLSESERKKMADRD